VPEGCRFHPRCPKVLDICHKVPPPSIGTQGESLVECHLYADSRK
jgi:oligopeptide/dipeptide ABC transporter ATP-binding protein